MELRQLKYFLAVADARSFVSAANALFVSRQAVSKAVAQLEGELGVELFMRDSSGAFLTPAGLKFYDRARGCVMELEQLREEMQRYGARYHQRIRLAVAIGVMPIYESALRDYQTAQENLELEYHEWPDEQCLTLLREREADVALCASRPMDLELASQPVLQSPLGVLLRASDWLDDTETVNIQDLTWLPLAGVNDQANRDFCARHGLGLRYSGYDTYRLFALAQEGRCALLLPQRLIPTTLTGLRWLQLENAPPWCVYSIHLQTLNHNVLYQTILEELHTNVFQHQ